MIFNLFIIFQCENTPFHYCHSVCMNLRAHDYQMRFCKDLLCA